MNRNITRQVFLILVFAAHLLFPDLSSFLEEELCGLVKKTLILQISKSRKLKVSNIDTF